MAIKLNVKIFDFSQVFGAKSGNGRIVEEIYDRNQYSIQIEAVVLGYIQIAMGGIWPKSRLRHPNRGDFFSPLTPVLPFKASPPHPLNWLCFARRGDD